MRRKIAFGITAAMTLILILLRSGLVPAWNELRIGNLDAAHIMPFIIVIITIALAILCFQKAPATCTPPAKWKAICGWFATFAGVVLTLTTLYNVVCLAVFGEIPPPNTVILNNIDNIAMLLMLLCGLAGGAFLALLGFQWMAGIAKLHPMLPWLSITPTLWMWFRLARYEISYASTVDISENVYDFSTMIFTSLFLIQLARATMEIGKPPKSGLLLFSLCTAMVTVSGIPSEFLSVPADASLSTLLVVVVDVVIGLFAAVYAAMLVFAKEPVKEPVKELLTVNEEPEQTDDMPKEEVASLVKEETDEIAVMQDDNDIVQAWKIPATPPAPVEPPFDIDSKLPEPPSPSAPADTNSEIDDILAQIDSDF